MQDHGGRDEGGAVQGAGPPGALVLEVALKLAGVEVPVRLGGQSWGQLNAARDNAVLVCHYYTGTMRAAGITPDGSPGWWDALIGPGRAVDTQRYFVVCLNSLSNVQAGDPGVVTSGPDTPHPDGGRWGGRFPAWDFADLHAAQLALMRQLELPRWHAVIGPSFGGMQALQWAARAPELAPRVAAIASSPRAGPVLRGVFSPLLRDVAPAGGLEGALRLITLFGLGPDGIETLFRDADFGAYLRGRMGTASLPHILDIGRVVLTHDLEAICPPDVLFAHWRRSGLRLLSVNIHGDGFFPAAEMRAFAAQSVAAGVGHTHLEFDSPHGHLGCIMDTHAFAEPLRALLDSGPRGVAQVGVRSGETHG
ncbi:alpha/beta fold hydrolase [Deinococcus koreensis]|uniref:Homoserine acetyltransferase n=1 Tax=Deinococcus koreensis TaxID=2054903 RepID=A0A2K3V065_9DEIO|nr:alpha/beta fold hydrolase [Deinococcus koreensis]PNY82173.1 homoserine acetyltransferase [Deinococcus koreensis]